MFIDDTIVAISSAAGSAARMIVRLSGAQSWRLLRDLTETEIAPAAPVRCVISFGRLEIPVWIYAFRSPRSYTGQDLVEFHIPGNPLLARMLVQWMMSRGARAAEAGEFTARAYFSGKLDLAQSEGVAAAISASGRGELEAARRLMGGELSRRLRPIMDRLGESLALSEVGIDFSEEDISVMAPEQARRRIELIRRQLHDLISQSSRFERLSHEPTIVMAGRPNAGKSTLINALAGRSRSIVSPIPGTTRDVLSAEITLKRGMVRLLDVAGIDESPQGKTDIESQMRRRAESAIAQADILVVVKDVMDHRPLIEVSRKPDLVVENKMDLSGDNGDASRAVRISAATGKNLDLLRNELDRLAFGESDGGTLALTARHLSAIDEACHALDRAAKLGPDFPLELLAAEFRAALDALGQILGVVTPDDVLGRIFSSFCIGK